MNKAQLTDLLYDDKKNEILFKQADDIRKKNVGDEIHLRALIEFSNICKCNCKYCGIRAENTNIERYNLSKDEILFYVKQVVDNGFKTIVLQSGESYAYSTDELCETIKKIKEYDVALTLSIGEKSFEEYKEYKKYGADRFLLRIETTDQTLFKEMHPNASYENRVNCLINLKSLGFELGTGCLVGLPNQTRESLANDILFFKEIGADMIGIGPFIPHENTPLGNYKTGDFWLALKVMALTRITMPDINIPATTAMETIHKNGRLTALNSGANVIMPNVLTSDIRKNYVIYPDKYFSNLKTVNEYDEYFKQINRRVAKNKGFRLK